MVAIRWLARYVNGRSDARRRFASRRVSRLTFREKKLAKMSLSASAAAIWSQFNRAIGRTLQPVRALIAIAVVAIGLAGCAEEFQKGYILPDGALEQIPIGATQDQVLIVLGTPSTIATLSGEVFYYISQRTRRRATFLEPQITDQRVIAVYFDKNRRVQRLANYGIQDGKIFDFISRTTPTSGQEMSYLTPLFKLLTFN
jgi:outer membrane protein assembly factor BamE (lipoprotein component of BamABCDE complex)